MIRRLVIAACLAPALFGIAASAQSADDIVNKHIAARGGLEKMRAIKTLKMSGTATLGPGLQAPFSMQLVRPGRMRMELSIQGKALVQATDGSAPWMINPFAGSTTAEAMSAEDAKDVQQQADIDGPLVDYKAKGHTVELLGKEDFEGTEVYKLKLTLKGGDVQFIYLDASTLLQLRETTKRTRDGKEMEIESFASNYKPVEGVLMPFAVETKINGQPQFAVALDAIEVNKPVDESVFKMPGK